MGAVYEVIHVETDRRRALKLMLPSFLQSEDMRARFRQEARVTARVESEYIVDVLDAGIDEATRMPFLVMEFLTGEELEKRLLRVGRFEPQEVVTYLQQAAMALDKTHKASIVHRDLKPANLFLTEREDGSPRIKLLDFGIAKLVAEGSTGGPATQILGTPLYMAPEQFHMGRKITPAADIFALGMMAYTLLVGRAYWQDEVSMGGGMYALIALVMHGPKEPPTVRAARHGVALPPEFDAWFEQVTALAPEERFHAASSAVVALGAVFGIQVTQRTPTVTGSGLRPVPVSAPPREPSYPPPVAPVPAPPPPRPVEAQSAPRDVQVNAPRRPEAPIAPPIQPSHNQPPAEIRSPIPGRQSQPSFSSWSPASAAPTDPTSPLQPIAAPPSMPTGAGVSNTTRIGKRGVGPMVMAAAALGAAALVAVVGVAFIRKESTPAPDGSSAAAPESAEPPAQASGAPTQAPPPPVVVTPSGTPGAGSTAAPTSVPVPSATPVEGGAPATAQPEAPKPPSTSNSAAAKPPVAPKPPSTTPPPKPTAPRRPAMTFD
jgi:serine/threonine-protein kinase